MKSLFKQLAVIAIWSLTIYFAWLAGPWTSDNSTGDEEEHDAMFHMHQPLHEGGKVTIKGQLHFEVVSGPDGNHRLWLSNAFRQEISPEGYRVKLQIEPLQGRPQEVAFEQVGRTFELQATTKPLLGQAWLILSGRLGDAAAFDNVRLFWDYDLESIGVRPPLGLDPMLPRSPGNPLTPDKAKLGRDLFFDTQLSADGSISCAMCHKPEFAFTDRRSVSTGIAGLQGNRNATSVLNVAYLPLIEWDGASRTLEQQARIPLFSEHEMGNQNETDLVARLRPDYGARTQEVFGEPLSLETIAKALACYERTLLSGNSSFDRFEAGMVSAMNQSARRGRSLFFGKANCGNCHVPPLFTDHDFHNLGVGWSEDPDADTGRFKVTGDSRDRGKFRTPSLRDVTRTGPYMHDGSVPTLRQVLAFYSRGGRQNPNLDPLINPLVLSPEEINDLLAFLKTLEGRHEGITDDE